MILFARNFAKTFVLTRLPEFLQPAVAMADRLLQRFQKVKLFQTVSRIALHRPLLAVRVSNPHHTGRTHQQLPRSKTPLS
ncbi:MAG: hypothetical protein AAF604_08555 [Acidobacteriota bacterium]